MQQCATTNCFGKLLKRQFALAITTSLGFQRIKSQARAHFLIVTEPLTDTAQTSCSTNKHLAAIHTFLV